jgi:hypothetical protein
MTLSAAQELKFFLDYTLAEMQDLKQNGRISDRLYGHYLFVWHWGAFHFGSHRQDSFLMKFGFDRLERRILRVKALIERIRNLPTPDPEHIPFGVGCLNP